MCLRGSVGSYVKPLSTVVRSSGKIELVSQGLAMLTMLVMMLMFKDGLSLSLLMRIFQFESILVSNYAIMNTTQFKREC